jgi:choline kinase
MVVGQSSLALLTGLIYAAGSSNRFNADLGSSGAHKCLQTVRDQPLILRQVELLVEVLSVDKLVVVIGPKHSEITDTLGQCWKGTPIEYVINDRPDQGNMWSLWVARNLIVGNCFLTTSDLVLSESMIHQFHKKLADQEVCWMGSLINKNTASDCVQLLIDRNSRRVVDIGKFDSFRTRAMAGVGYYYFPESCVGLLLSCVRDWVADQKVIPSLYFAFRAFLKLKEAYVIKVDGSWVDVDTLDDLNIARQLFE